MGCEARPPVTCEPTDEACICKSYGDCDGGASDNGADDARKAGPVGLPKCTLWADTAEIERKLIVPTCGKPSAPGQDPRTVPACHNGTFVPEMDVSGMIEDNLMRPSQSASRMRLTCKQDPWINTNDWTKSYLVAKTDPAAQGANVKNAIRCPSNGAGGMARMPFSTDNTPAPPLTTAEYDCIRFYAYKLAGN
jgi:hypothetical protein